MQSGNKYLDSWNSLLKFHLPGQHSQNTHGGCGEQGCKHFDPRSDAAQITEIAERYTASSSEINEALRTKRESQIDPEIMEQVRELDKLMADSYVPRRQVHYRAFHPDDAEKIRNKAVGDRFVDRRFYSTSLSRNLVESDYARNGETIIKIVVPEGAHAVDFSTTGHNEIVLPRGGYYEKLDNNTLLWVGSTSVGGPNVR